MSLAIVWHLDDIAKLWCVKSPAQRGPQMHVRARRRIKIRQHIKIDNDAVSRWMLTSAHHDLRFATRCFDAAQPSDDMKPIKVKFPSKGIASIQTGIRAVYCKALGNSVAPGARVQLQKLPRNTVNIGPFTSGPSRSCDKVGQPFFTRPVGRRKMQVDTSQ